MTVRAEASQTIAAGHLYESRWSDIDTDQEDTFLLMPISAETFELALEDWAIWRRWEIAFHEGRTSVDTHPALPEDRTRYDEIKQELNKRLVMDESQAICAKATFQAIEQVKSEPGVEATDCRVERGLLPGCGGQSHECEVVAIM